MSARWIAKFCLAFFVGGAAVGCDNANVADSSVVSGLTGGTEATKDDAIRDYVVAVFHTNRVTDDPDEKQPYLDAGWCTGVVVARRLIVTAAHCVSDPQFEMEIYATTDINKLEGLERYATVARRSHPDYQFSFDPRKLVPKNERYDIAVVKVDRDLPARMKAMPLVEDERATRQMSGPWVAGMGMSPKNPVTEQNNPGERLRFGKLTEFPIRENETRAIIEGMRKFQQDSDVLLANLQNAGMCTGDSGGPVYIFNEDKPFAPFLIGITAGYLPTVPDCRGYGVAADTVWHYEWLKETIKELNELSDAPAKSRRARQ